MKSFAPYRTNTSKLTSIITFADRDALDSIGTADLRSISRASSAWPNAEDRHETPAAGLNGVIASGDVLIPDKALFTQANVYITPVHHTSNKILATSRIHNPITAPLTNRFRPVHSLVTTL